MEQELRNRLLETAERLTVIADLSEQAIGQRALHDNTFFKRLRSGKSGFTVRTYDRLMAWMLAAEKEAIQKKRMAA